MSLGTGAVKVGRVPEHLRPRQAGIHRNPLSGNHPCKQLPTGTVTLKPVQWKSTHLTPILGKAAWNFWREGGAGSLNPQRFAQNTGKMIHQDQLKNKQSAMPSKGRPQNPCNHPTSCNIHFRGNSHTPMKHKPATSISSFLTLPK